MFNVVDANNFEKQVIHANDMVLVNFWAWWSYECRKMSSLMKKVDGILDEGDTIVQIDWDQQKKLAQELEVFGVPTLLIYVGGREVARYSGIMRKNELLKRIMDAKKGTNSFGRKEVRNDIIQFLFK